MITEKDRNAAFIVLRAMKQAQIEDPTAAARWALQNPDAFGKDVIKKHRQQLEKIGGVWK